MKGKTEVYLYGSLRRGPGESIASPVLDNLDEPISLGKLIHRLQIQPDQVQLAMVNHRAVSPDHMIQPGDRVSIFPREYAIFADWKNFRQ
ncbi:MAG: MoaD/ThiS family protein [Deltaproteobacteria bacterium]|nr:MoaD/ThiS family protein [Deltaproteobacteria bacterium]